MDEKKLEQCATKVLEYCSAELSLSAPEVVLVLDKAYSEADDAANEKYWSEGQ